MIDYEFPELTALNFPSASYDREKATEDKGYPCGATEFDLRVRAIAKAADKPETEEEREARLERLAEKLGRREMEEELLTK